MKKIIMLTSLLYTYSTVQADASCCGTKRKHETATPTSESAKKFKKAPMETEKKLEYKVLKSSESGIKPKPGSRVTVHYTGWFKNDTKPENFEYGQYDNKAFDSSLKRGKKFEFTIGVGQVIRGWDEGVMGMQVGEKRRLYIPSNLGYGPQGFPGAIPPNADLVFDVELFDVSK
jgi:FKBP-type peptidyl-prolyl cis-trans isomerase